jgi:nucleoside-diphosphate-sugar epimerase
VSGSSAPRDVLVTGASGWLGTNFVRALREGFPDSPELAGRFTVGRLRCLVPDASGWNPPAGVETVVGDLRNPDDCRRFAEGAKGAILFHLAGVIHPRRVKEFYEVNVDGTRNVLEAAVAADVSRVVALSSNSPCGCNPRPDHVFDESSPYHPYMNYGRSKVELERLVNRFGAEGKIETVLIRAPWFYGPNQPERQSLFFKMIRQGKVPLVGDGTNRRSMAYLGNLVQGLVLAAITPAAMGQTYWIADERPYPFLEIIETIRDVLKKDFGMDVRERVVRVPSVVGDVAYIGDRLIQGLGLYHPKVHVLSEMHRTIACSIGKARRELGFRPGVELREGMRRSIESCLKAGHAI